MDPSRTIVAIKELTFIKLIQILKQSSHKEVVVYTHFQSILTYFASSIKTKLKIKILEKGSFYNENSKKMNTFPFSNEDISRYSFFCTKSILSKFHYNEDVNSSDYLRSFLYTYSIYRISKSLSDLLFFMSVEQNIKANEKFLYMEKDFYSQEFIDQINHDGFFNIEIKCYSKNIFDLLDISLTKALLKLANLFKQKKQPFENLIDIKIPSSKERMPRFKNELDDNKKHKSKPISGYICFPVFDGISSFGRSELDAIKDFNDYRAIKSVIHSRPLRKSEKKIISNSRNISKLNQTSNLLRTPFQYILSLLYFSFIWKKTSEKYKHESEILLFSLKQFKKKCIIQTYDWYKYFKNEKIKTIVVSDYMEPAFCKVFAIELLGGISIYNDRTTGYSFPDYTYIVPSHIRTLNNYYAQLMIPWHKSSLFFYKSTNIIKSTQMASLVSKEIQNFTKGKTIISVFDENIDSILYQEFYNGVLSIAEAKDDFILLIKPKKLAKFNSLPSAIKSRLIKLRRNKNIFILDVNIKSVDLISLSNAVVSLPSTIFFDSTIMKKMCFVYDKYGAMKNYFMFNGFNNDLIYSNLSVLISDLSTKKFKFLEFNFLPILEHFDNEIGKSLETLLINIHSAQEKDMKTFQILDFLKKKHDFINFNNINKSVECFGIDI